MRGSGAFPPLDPYRHRGGPAFVGTSRELYGSPLEWKGTIMAHATDIVAYTYRADTYCPGCIADQMPTGIGEKFDGWGVNESVNMGAEEFLAGIAHAFGIDRMNEYSFDSEDFPKVVFSSQVEETEHCGGCGEIIDA